MDLAAVIEGNVSAALAEDIGMCDWTARLTAEDTTSHATILCRGAAVLCGRKWAHLCFEKLDPDARIAWAANDGDALQSGASVCEITGATRALLTAERTALNFLQTLSGVSTKTRRYVEAVAGTRAKIVDTRKTLPGLRLAQKYAVRVGGGLNHRIGLYDGILIKENHIASGGGIRPVLARAQTLAEGANFVMIEVETLEQL